MEELLELGSLDALVSYLQSRPTKRTRSRLIKAFWRNSKYRTVQQWNLVVRLCEALAIVGWGDYEPVEAKRGTYFNGWPTTKFLNRYSEGRYLEAMWSKRKEGLQIVTDRLRYHGSPDLGETGADASRPEVGLPQDLPLHSQRNWIVKNPIMLAQTVANCYESSDGLVRAVKRLASILDREMQPERYGSAINRIGIYYHLSYRDPGCATNYVIQEDDSQRLTNDEKNERLADLYSVRQIKEMHYRLVPRFLFRPFAQKRVE